MLGIQKDLSSIRGLLKRGTSKELSGMSISDSNIRHYNKLICVTSNRRMVEKLLLIGKELGLTVGGSDSEIVDKLVELEDRDRLAKNVRGSNKVDQ